ncbi:MAG: D-alanine--D-alanine ligase [Clostridia bacterium]|nr:D-alanine--D-alanine ligase [Clostridia bacterium]
MKIKLAVMFGGKSVEHEISVISAIQAIGAVNKDKYDVIPIYITKNNEMYVGEHIGDIEAYKNINKLLSQSTRVNLIADGGRALIVKYPHKAFAKDVVDYIDIAFPVVHGTNVEDGTLQGYLKMLNLPYVGCDVLSSAVGMDKYVMKTVLKDNDIPVLDCVCVDSRDFGDEPEKIIEKIESKFSYPVIVKPINLGSSIGISKAKDTESLETSLENAFDFADRVLVEPAIENLREINCSVLGDRTSARASVCEEPLNATDILSYEDKYIGNASKSGSKGMASTSRQIPADIPQETEDEIRNMAVEAFKVLGCNGVSRIDFMIDTAENKVWLNEINTIPGSLSFYLWEPAGVSYTELIDEMISLALKREREAESITYSFDTNVLSGIKLGGKKTGKM